MASTTAFAGAGLALLVVGILAVAAGLGMMVFSQDDAGVQEQGAADDARASNDRQGRLGQTIAVGGGAVAFLALIFIVIGRAEDPPGTR